MLSEAAREAQKRYRAAWNQKNRDRIREYNRRYWEKKAAAEEADKQEAAK